MLTWSARRRLTYIAIVVVLIAIAALSLWIVYKPVASCFDGKQNNDEGGMDCGGSCALVCKNEILPLRVLWTRLFAVSEGKYDVAALVKNPNVNHGATNAKYVFKVWDSNNLLISNKRGEIFFNPKEDLIIFESRVDVGKKIPMRVAFEWDGAPVWQKNEKQDPSISFSGKNFNNEPSPRLTANIKNNSLVDVKEIQVLAILSDDSKNAVAVSSSFVESLPAGTSQEVAFTWPKSFAGKVSFVDLSAHYDWWQLP